MAKPSLASLASGVMSRLGQLTLQTAQKARVSAGKAAHLSLVEVNRLLDDALEATKPDAAVITQAKLPAKSAKSVTKVKTKAKVETKSALLPAPKAKKTAKR